MNKVNTWKNRDRETITNLMKKINMWKKNMWKNRVGNSITILEYMKLTKKEKKEAESEFKLEAFPFLVLYSMYTVLQLGIEEFQGYPRMGIFRQNGFWIFLYFTLIIIIFILNITGFRFVRNRYFKKRPELKKYYKENNLKIKYPPHIFFMMPIFFLDYYPMNWTELIIWTAAIYLIFIGPKPGRFYFWEKAILRARVLAEKTNAPMICNIDSENHVFLLILIILFPSVTFQVFGLYPIIPIFSFLIGEKMTNYVFVENYKKYFKRRDKIFLRIETPICIISALIPGWIIIDPFLVYSLSLIG